MTAQTINATQWAEPRRHRKLVRFLVNGAMGLVLAVLTYKALSVLPSFYDEMQVLGIIEQPVISTAGLRLLGCAVIALLYALSPLLGGVIAVFSLVLPVAMLSPVYAVPYLVLAVFSVVALTQRGAPLLIALVPLAVFYPPVALLLPLIPVLAAILYGRAFGPYLAACASLALLVIALLSGVSAVGGVYVEGHVEPFADNEFMTDDLTLLPPLSDDPELLRIWKEGNIGDRLAFVYLVLHWSGPMLFVGLSAVYLYLLPKLLAPTVIAQFILWVAASVGVSWLTWVATKRRTVWSVLGTATAAIAGTLVVGAGHLIIPRLFGAASAPPSVFQGITSAGLSAIVAAVCALIVAWLRTPRAPSLEPPEVPAAPTPVTAPGTAAPAGASVAVVGPKM